MSDESKAPEPVVETAKPVKPSFHKWSDLKSKVEVRRLMIQPSMPAQPQPSVPKRPLKYRVKKDGGANVAGQVCGFKAGQVLNPDHYGPEKMKILKAALELEEV